jgi:aspartyl-tRNA(Asn)/glutamyl-tRNA(Gln) amidotransferase subunit B
VSPSALAGLIALVESGTLSTKLGKDVLAKMWGTGSTADAIVQKENLAQVSDTGAIESAVAAVIDAHPSEVERLKGGDKKLTGFFVGQVMKATGGKANPKTVNEMLGKLLGL